MRKLMVAAGAAMLLAVTPLAALADEASGSITAVDDYEMTVTLDDGNTYQLPEDSDTASLQVGDKVIIEYTKQADGAMVATEVKPQD